MYGVIVALRNNHYITYDSLFLAVNSRIIDNLLPKHKLKVLSKISEKLPLSVTANLIQDEGYWERCSKARWEKGDDPVARWEICDVVQYGGSWKRMFFER